MPDFNEEWLVKYANSEKICFAVNTASNIILRWRTIFFFTSVFSERKHLVVEFFFIIWNEDFLYFYFHNKRLFLAILLVLIFFTTQNLDNLTEFALNFLWWISKFYYVQSVIFGSFKTFIGTHNILAWLRCIGATWIFCIVFYLWSLIQTWWCSWWGR